MSEAKKVSTGIKIWGWIVMIMGILALASPFVSGVAVVYMVGAMLVIAGISRLIEAFQGGGFWEGLLGVITAVAGVITIAHPLLGLATLTMVLIFYFMMLGISEIVGAFQIRPEQGWGFLLFSGIVSLVLSFMLWNQWPLAGTWAVGVLVGVQLIFSGMTMITLGSAVKRIGEEIQE